MINQYNDLNFGIIIVKKDLSTIFYKNSAVENFYVRNNNYHKNNIKNENKEYSFKEIFNIDKNPELEKVFITELKKTDNYGYNTFIFPITNKFFSKEENYLTLLFKFVQNYEDKNFIKIIANQCYWKNGIDCYFIMIIQNPFILNNGLLSFERFIQINKYTHIFLDNLNNICYKLTTNNDNINKNNHNNKEDNLKKQKSLGNSLINKFEKKNNGSNYFKKLTDLFNKKNNSSLNDEEKENNEVETNFDYTILFYIRNSLNYIYDLTLTHYVFNSIIINQYIDEYKLFNFNNFLEYMISYLTPIAKVNHFNIELKNDLNENVYANYTYIRVLIFNIILFILNNSSDKKEKTLKIKNEHFKFDDNGNYYEISFSFNDKHPIISYKKLNKFFSNFNVLKYKNINPKLLFENGLLVSYLISNSIFSSKEKKFKTFSIEANEEKIIVLTIIYIPEVTKLNTEKKFFSEYNNLKKNNLLNIITNKIITIQSKYMNKEKENYTFYDEKEQSKSNKYDDGKNDIFNQKEENYTLEEEKKLAFTININNALFFQNKYDGKEIKPENFIVQNMMCKLTNNKYVIYKNKIELLKNNVNYYNIPRFLIFEKYINFAQEIIEKLRELKLKFLYEIVEDDETGLKAFKKLNKRGYIFDFIFIDMYLINKIGIDVLKKIREISSKFNIKINIICLKNEDEKCKIDENLIDDYIDKSIKDTQRLKELILKHMKEVRKEKI